MLMDVCGTLDTRHGPPTGTRDNDTPFPALHPPRKPQHPASMLPRPRQSSRQSPGCASWRWLARGLASPTRRALATPHSPLRPTTSSGVLSPPYADSNLPLRLLSPSAASVSQPTCPGTHRPQGRACLPRAPTVSPRTQPSQPLAALPPGPRPSQPLAGGGCAAARAHAHTRRGEPESRRRRIRPASSPPTLVTRREHARGVPPQSAEKAQPSARGYWPISVESSWSSSCFEYVGE